MSPRCWPAWPTTPADRRAESDQSADGIDHATTSRTMPDAGAGRSRPAAALGQAQDRLLRAPARRRSSACPSSRRCATRAATSRTTRSPISTSTSRRSSATSSALGGHVHWARDAAEARAHRARALPSGRRHDRHQGQSRWSPRRSALNDHLEAQRHRAGRDRSRRIHHPAAPRAAEPHHRAGGPPDQGRRSPTPFRAASRELGPPRGSTSAAISCAEARRVLRQHFLAADVGITGANFLVAETGSAIIVTNEGNGDLTQTLPQDAHRAGQPREGRPDAGGRRDAAAPAGALGDRPGILVLHDAHRPARSAPGDLDGPEQYHVVLLDNGRIAMLGSELQDMLRCIRCGACMNHCPVYGAIGGHAYGWVYPGPMGAVLTPQLDRHRARPATCPTPRPSAAAARASARSASRCPS